MKLSRIELKALVKECLLELLAEGLGPVTTPRVTERRAAVQRRPAAQPARPGPGRAAVPPPVKEAIRRHSGGDPVLAGILADTAATTLPAMLEGERQGPVLGDAAQRAVATVAPEQMFDTNAVGRWSQLAFMPGRPGASGGLPADDDGEPGQG